MDVGGTSLATFTQYICPVCKTRAEKDLREHLSLGLHFRLIFVTLFVAFLAYQLGGAELAWKTLFLYLPLWAVGEFLHGVHLRHRVRCEFCGFDPLLYARDWREARRLVQAKLQGKVDEVARGIDEQRRLYMERMKRAPVVTPRPDVATAPTAKAVKPSQADFAPKP